MMSCVLPQQVPDALKEILGPDAPDVCIEAVGFHYINSWLHKVENALLMETDTSEILNELIYCCRKVHLVLNVLILFTFCPLPSCQCCLYWVLAVMHAAFPHERQTCTQNKLAEACQLMCICELHALSARCCHISGKHKWRWTQAPC